MARRIKGKTLTHPYRNSFVDCSGLEIYEMVYGQTSRFVAAGLLVTISRKPTLHPYSNLKS